MRSNGISILNVPQQKGRIKEICNMIEEYTQKEYKSKGAFINACGKALGKVYDSKYPEDELTAVYFNDGRTVKEILEEDEQLCYSSLDFSIDFNMNTHIYVYSKY